MGDMATEAKSALTEATSRLDRLETQFKNMGGFPAASNESGTQNNATWNVNAGGVGVWLCATACAIMLALTIVLGVLFIDLSRKYDRMQDYYNIILQHAPALKDIIQKESK